MGAESYLVRLCGEVSAARMRDAILALPGAAPDPESGFGMEGSEYFSVRHGGHVFELELFEPSSGQPVLSLRFALAHPPTVDAAFLALVRRLMTDAALRVQLLADDVPPEYDLDHFEHFTALVLEHIAEERRLWIAMFGPQTLAASTAEVFRRIILPQCEPVGVDHTGKVVG